jgi:hypothetical protein
MTAALVAPAALSSFIPPWGHSNERRRHDDYAADGNHPQRDRRFTGNAGTVQTELHQGP